MKSPRSPRVIRLLDSLEAVYTGDSSTSAERLEAARLAAQILGRKKPKARKKDKRPTANVKPPEISVELATSKTDPEEKRSAALEFVRGQRGNASGF